MTDAADLPEEFGGRRRMPRSRRIAIIAAAVVLAAALTLILIPVVSSLSDGQPHVYTSKDYAFRVTFPGRPNGTNPAAGGDPSQLYVAWQKDTTSLIVQAHTLTAAERAIGKGELLDQRLTEAAALFGGKTAPTPTSAKLDGQSAREAEFSLGGHDSAREVVFVRNDRLFSIIMVNATDVQQTDFLRSLHFID